MTQQKNKIQASTGLFRSLSIVPITITQGEIQLTAAHFAYTPCKETDYSSVSKGKYCGMQTVTANLSCLCGVSVPCSKTPQRYTLLLNSHILPLKVLLLLYLYANKLLLRRWRWLNRTERERDVITAIASCMKSGDGSCGSSGKFTHLT